MTPNEDPKLDTYGMVRFSSLTVEVLLDNTQPMTSEIEEKVIQLACKTYKVPVTSTLIWDKPRTTSVPDKTVHIGLISTNHRLTREIVDSERDR